MTDRYPPHQSVQGNSISRNSSSLRDSLLKARIAKLPHLPAIAPNRQEIGTNSLCDNVVEDQDEEACDSLGSLSMPKSIKSTSKLRSVHANVQDEYSPISADDCFSEALEIDVEEEQLNEGEFERADIRPTQLSGDQASTASPSIGRKTTFRVYYTPPKRAAKINKSFPTTSSSLLTPNDKPPSVSLSSLHQNQEEDEEEDDGESNPTIFLLHHGAGYSALSFALAAKSISQQTRGKAGVLAYDCRGHGKTAHPNEPLSSELSLDRLTKDGLAILSKVFPPEAKQPNLVLVGHSMGGAVVVSMAHALTDSAITISKPRVAGVAVLDVVEGTAISALPSMKTIIAQLPKGFDSISGAIQWHIDSGTIVNPQSARRSVPSLLRPNESFTKSAKAAVEEEPMEEMISETGIQDIEKEERPVTSYPFVWRHDLLATEPFWKGWFEGLSDSFLKVKCARLLLLAGTDRLDKELMIGQMQGKYQLVVFPDVGHSLQEDAPQRTAQTLVEFWRRNEMVDVKTIKSLRKVGEM